VTRFFRHFLHSKYAEIRTLARLWIFVIQLTSFCFHKRRFWHVQPTAKRAFPGFKPPQILASGKARLAFPRHFRRAVGNVLVWANVIVVKAKFVHRLLQRCFAVNLNMANGAFEGAKKALNPAVLPRLMRFTSLVVNVEKFHAYFEFVRHKSAVVVGAQGFRFAEAFGQLPNQIQHGIGAFFGEGQRQILAAAVVDYADQNVRFAFNVDVSKIQGPSLIWSLWRWRFSIRFAQTLPFVARFFLEIRDKCFAHADATAGKFCVESVGDGAAAGFFHQRQQAQKLSFYPRRFGFIFGVGLALFGHAAAMQAEFLGGDFSGSSGDFGVYGRDHACFSVQEKKNNHQQNQQVVDGYHGAAAALIELQAWQGYQCEVTCGLYSSLRRHSSPGGYAGLVDPGVHRDDVRLAEKLGQAKKGCEQTCGLYSNFLRLGSPGCRKFFRSCKMS
jgi:hypothetical protein